MRTWINAIAVVAGLTATLVAHAQAFCPPKPFRWMEDCRPGDTEPRPVDLPDRLRYLPIADDDRSTWLTLGAEYRVKLDSLDAPSFGLRGLPDYSTIGHRVLVHGDLRTAQGARLFVQLSAAAERGRQPAERPFDRSAVDLAQAFVDLPLQWSALRTTLRIGRQELDLGGNRLVSPREAANLRRAFDQATLFVTAENAELTAFSGRPVANQAGAFDDRRSNSERFRGINLRLTLPIAGIAPTMDVFNLVRERDRAVFQEGAAAETRRTTGVRAAAASSSWDAALQWSVQHGDFGALRIRAWGVAGDIGVRAPALWGAPRLGMSFGRASGDRSAGDGILGTFDVIYPNLSYFTDAPLIYPGNTWDVQPNLRLTVTHDATMQVGCDLVYRLSAQDAIYEPPGIPLVRPGRGDAPSSRVAALAFAKLDRRFGARASLSVSFVYAAAGDVVTAAGGKDSVYTLAQLAWRL